MEQKQFQVDEGISIVDIFKLLLSKVKFLIIAFLIGGILGASVAVWKTVDINHFGTTVEFYVNPEKAKDNTTNDNSQYGVYGAYGKHVMDNMIKLLGSESFAETMILNGESLPEKDKWADTAEKTASLNAKIDAAATELDALEKLQEDLEKAVNASLLLTEAMAALQEELDTQWVSLYYDGIVASSAFSVDEYKKKIEGLPQEHPDYYKVEIIQQLYVNWAAYSTALEQKTQEIVTKQEALEPVQERADAALEEALEEWRKTSKYKSTLARYTAAVNFSYLRTGESSEDTNDLARSFIYVDIFVLNDESFASEVLSRVKTVVPAYVEKNMTVPSGYVGTNCKRITRTDDIRMTNPGYTTQQALKYGTIAAFVTLLAACIVVLIADKADKRLRDTSTITKQFGVPILGLIPTIEELNAEIEEEAEGTDTTETKDKEAE